MLTVSYNLSRGELVVPYAFDIIIDLYIENPTIIINGLPFWDDIIAVNERGNTTELIFYSKRDECNYTLFFHFNEDGTMWIESLPEGAFLPTGKNRIYYKMGNIAYTGEYEPNPEFTEMARENSIWVKDLQERIIKGDFEPSLEYAEMVRRDLIF
jgi:hypothetical protein